MRDQSSIFAMHNFEATLKRITEASPPPTFIYTSQDWYDREIKEIFRKEWLCVGRVEMVATRGDYYTLEVVGDPIIIVRGRDDKIRAFLNVCRHRGTVIAKGSGNCRTLRCPYHQWTYALDGRLLGTPGKPDPMVGVENFDLKEYGLIELKSADWGGFIFLTFNDDAPILMEWLGDLPEFAKNYRFDDFRATRATFDDVRCNWKVIAENSIDHYHQDVVHLTQLDRKTTQIWTMEKPRGPAVVTYGTGSLTMKNANRFETIQGLSEKQRKGAYWLWVKPHVALNLTPYYMLFRLQFPVGVERTYVYSWFCFPSESVRDGDPGLRDAAFYGGRDQVFEEDTEIASVIQRGLRSSLGKLGRYSPREEGAHRIATYVINQVADR